MGEDVSEGLEKRIKDLIDFCTKYKIPYSIAHSTDEKSKHGIIASAAQGGPPAHTMAIASMVLCTCAKNIELETSGAMKFTDSLVQLATIAQQMKDDAVENKDEAKKS